MKKKVETGITRQAAIAAATDQSVCRYPFPEGLAA